MIRILHGSDVHFGKPFVPEAAEAFLQAAEELTPDVIVLSGDFTQRAKVEEYRAARAFLDRLPPVPLVVTPGNHDVPLYRFWERAAAPLRNYREYIHPELDTVTHVEGATLVALNSASPYTAIVNGRLGRDQLDFARRAFTDAPSSHVRIAVIHHNLISAPDYDTDRPLPGAGRLLDELEDLGVEIVLSGHLHRGFVASSLDARPRPGQERDLLMIHSGTTSSRRGRGRERGHQTCNFLEVQPGELVVRHLLFVPERRRFEAHGLRVLARGATEVLPPHRGAWLDDALAGGAP